MRFVGEEKGTEQSVGGWGDDETVAIRRNVFWVSFRDFEGFRLFVVA